MFATEAAARGYLHATGQPADTKIVPHRTVYGSVRYYAPKPESRALSA